MRDLQKKQEKSVYRFSKKGGQLDERFTRKGKGIE